MEGGDVCTVRNPTVLLVFAHADYPYLQPAKSTMPMLGYCLLLARYVLGLSSGQFIGGLGWLQRS